MDSPAPYQRGPVASPRTIRAHWLRTPNVRLYTTSPAALTEIRSSRLRTELLSLRGKGLFLFGDGSQSAGGSSCGTCPPEAQLHGTRRSALIGTSGSGKQEESSAARQDCLDCDYSSKKTTVNEHRLKLKCLKLNLIVNIYCVLKKNSYKL